MRKQHKIGDGPNRIDLVTDGDSVYAEGHGHLSYEIMVSYFALIDAEVGAFHKVIYLITSARHVKGPIDSKSRRYLAEWTARNHIGGLAVIGADWVTRGISIVIFNAAYLLNKTRIPLAFFPTAEAAQPWIAELRRKAQLS